MAVEPGRRLKLVRALHAFRADPGAGLVDLGGLGPSCFHRPRQESTVDEARDLGIDPSAVGGYCNFAVAINDSGRVLGLSRNVFGEVRTFLTAPGRAVDPERDDLGELDPRASRPDKTYHAFADKPCWLGALVVADKVPGTVHDGHRGPRTPGRLLDEVRGGSTIGFDLNDRGQVVGMSFTQRGYAAECFLTRPGRPLDRATDDLGMIDAHGAYGYPFPEELAAAVNDRGQAAGIGFRTAPGAAFRRATDRLGAFLGSQVEDDVGWTWGVALGINEAGWAVGHAPIDRSDGVPHAPRRHAFVHDGERMLDLNALVANGEGWVLEVANDVNDLGQIVGDGFNPAGLRRGFLLTPLPDYEPPLLLATGTALSGLAFAWRRRAFPDWEAGRDA